VVRSAPGPCLSPDTEDVREISQGNYRIIYRVGPGHVDVLTVFHGARLLHESDIES